MTERENERKSIRELWERIFGHHVNDVRLDTIVTYWPNSENSEITIETKIPFSLANATTDKEEHIK